jgi:hypothetical protein
VCACYDDRIVRSLLRRYGPSRCGATSRRACLLVHVPITRPWRPRRRLSLLAHLLAVSPFDGLAATMQVSVAQTRSCNDDQHPSIVRPASN